MITDPWAYWLANRIPSRQACASASTASWHLNKTRQAVNITCFSQSRATTPMPASPVCGTKEPSTLTLIHPARNKRGPNCCRPTYFKLKTRGNGPTHKGDASLPQPRGNNPAMNKIKAHRYDIARLIHGSKMGAAERAVYLVISSLLNVYEKWRSHR